MTIIKRLAVIFLALVLIGCAGQQRQRYVNSNPDLMPSIKKHILAGEIIIGMTEEQVDASWGFPSRQHRSFSHGRSTKTWAYGHGGYYTYIHFTDGLVTGISRNF